MEILRRIATTIDALNEKTGQIFAWLSLAMVLVQFLVVVERYVFGIGSVWTQESIVYMHGTMFMVLAGYTLRHNEHVRVDIIYRGASPRYKAIIDIIGTFIFLWPMCYLTYSVALPYVQSSWSVLEGSKETSGIQGVFLLKSVILVFCILLALQGLATVLHAIRELSGSEPPADEPLPAL
ncbi:MAG: TRAP transporter small permease subunit [Rhizobiales bacterium]|nr:TRAP transporter small permease subunit [Hyphomicrobiales bacterium]